MWILKKKWQSLEKRVADLERQVQGQPDVKIDADAIRQNLQKIEARRDNDVIRMEFQSVQMNNGEIFDGAKIGELTKYIINKFSEEGLSYDEAKIVMDKVSEIAGEFSKVQLMY